MIAQLRRRGYLRRPRPAGAGERALGGATAAPAAAELRKAVLALQEAYHLPKTGKVDAELKAFLDEPYCDVPDPYGPAMELLGGAEGGVGWRDTKVTYQFMHFSTKISNAEVRSAFEAAFRTWEGVCRLRFSEVTAQGDMRIAFGAGDHGDQWPFEGPGRALAHAFYPNWPDPPLRGDVHVDDDESWVLSAAPPAGAKDLASVVLHEVGHAIGLPHSTVPGSVMWPNYTGVLRTLQPSDVAAIKAVYP